MLARLREALAEDLHLVVHALRRGDDAQRLAHHAALARETRRLRLMAGSVVLPLHNPLRIAFHEWAALFRDLFRSRSPREAFFRVFGPPGWQPDGKGPTAANLRAAWRAGTPAATPARGGPGSPSTA